MAEMGTDTLGFGGGGAMGLAAGGGGGGGMATDAAGGLAGPAGLGPGGAAPTF